MKSCPVCGQSYLTAGEALKCWLAHEPDFPSRLTLREMSERVGVTRERVRQVLKKLGYQRRVARGRPRKRPRPALSAEAKEKLRQYYRERERDPRRKEYKKRRDKERMATDPAYRELKRAKARRKYARRKARRASHPGT